MKDLFIHLWAWFIIIVKAICNKFKYFSFFTNYGEFKGHDLNLKSQGPGSPSRTIDTHIIRASTVKSS